MKLSISNIGWQMQEDDTVYGWMKEYGYSGLEIAPTRVFSERPYDKLQEARDWFVNLRAKYGFYVSSMQSIWYGRQEKIFGTEHERQQLLDYTKRAIDFAETIECKNLVFGCPKNRIIHAGADTEIIVSFFKELGNYASQHHTMIGLEANPPIYNTNYINDTESALELIKRVDSVGFKLNLDIGTIIQNEEDVNELVGNVNLISHVHISEPRLKIIEKRILHRIVRNILETEGYQGFVSVEMEKTDNLQNVRKVIDYVKGVFE